MNCPRCTARIAPAADTCPDCGVDLACLRSIRGLERDLESVHGESHLGALGMSVEIITELMAVWDQAR